MSTPSNPAALTEALTRFFGAPRFTASLTLVIIGVTFSTHALRSTMGWPGLIGMLIGLLGFAALSLWARRDTLEWHGVLPISILVFVGWCVLSLVWSEYTLATLRGVSYQVTFGFLAIYVALVRDSIQIVRAIGDVLRVLLGASIALEVLSLLIDLPIVFLGIQGNIAYLGPIQGVFGTRNALGLIALIAVITFIVEWKSRSVPRALGIGSVWLAGICLVLTRSPVILIVALCIAVAAVALYALRRAPAANRWMLQLGLAAATLVTVVTLWATREQVFGLLNAGAELNVRLSLWDEMVRLMPLHPLEGWGWAGVWPSSTPYGWLEFTTGRDYSSGLNAYLDVYFQVGLVGALAFVALVGLAFVRSWILASNKRSLVYVWPALVLVVLIVTSLAESTALVEYGWFLLLVCSVRAAQGLSWRSALARKPDKV
ncbi:exopolysaccharide production protein [Cryobacterium melibiosiphilum]|uniref:Exopolysaccharide production protein n=1 Tax=Cryobacterium melibiosiphilum TaxID=995039 RepID=A0A3A5MP26_9MICO|nr:O-antigen ligase family protein [Cryobacterium melibiosiphilum]RJT87816.1 exopolysaccharide production protein [Cryobacterium melibiosiphilum]